MTVAAFGASRSVAEFPVGPTKYSDTVLSSASVRACMCLPRDIYTSK